MTQAMKTRQTFTATSPDGSETATITTTRAIVWATWGFQRLDQGAAATGEGGWVHLGWSIRSGQIQAESSARSTGPYFHGWKATRVDA